MSTHDNDLGILALTQTAAGVGSGMTTAKSDFRIFWFRSGWQVFMAWRRIVWSTIIYLIFAGSLVIAQQTNELMIDSFQYPTQDAARTAWIPVTWAGSDAGQPVVSPSAIENVSGLSFPCIFTTSTVRGAWTKNVSLNLSAYTHLRFRVNGSAAAQGFGSLYIYFKTGSGGSWRYQNIGYNDQWRTMIIPLTDFTAEGTCTDWSDIRSICISAWKSTPGAGSLAFSDMRGMLSTSANMLLNGGFEITNTENLPDYWGSGGWGLTYNQWVETPGTDTWRACWGVDRTVRHSGTNSLLVSSAGDITQLKVHSNWLQVKAGQSYTFSAWLKSDQNSLPVNMAIATWAYQSVTVNNTWTRYSFSGTAPPDTPENDNSKAYCWIYQSGTGKLWIDDVQLEAGSTASNFQPAFQDGAINTQTVHRTPADPADYPYASGGSSVTVSIDSNCRFLVDGQPFVPIAAGWDCSPTSRPSLATIQEIARAGFNSLSLYAKPGDFSYLQPILDDARTCGLKVIFCVARDVTTVQLEDWITNLKYHSAIIVWNVYDEPDPAEEWNEALTKYNAAKANDPGRPAFVNFLWRSLPATAWYGDILSTDFYPVPNYSPLTVAYLAGYLEQLAAPALKPVWMWQQSAGYAYSAGREPTGPEAECTVYSSMIRGARGFIYFEYKPRSAELWTELRALTRELRTLTPILSSTNTLFASASPPSVHLLSKSYNGQNYVIAVNESSVPVTAIISGVSGTSSTVLFENRSLPVSGGTITDTFAGYQRHVYQY